MSDHTTCAAFDAAIAELAFELLDANERDLLMRHAAGCDRCRAELESSSSVADQLVMLAPEGEPPVGFEQRALETMIGPVRQLKPRQPRWLLAAAAAAIVVAGVAGAVLGRSTHSTDPRSAGLDIAGITAVRSARLVNPAGEDHGSVVLTSSHGVLLTMTLTDLDAGTYHCWISGDDGVDHEVAAWPIDGTRTGVWAVPLDASGSAVRRVEVTESNGSTVATADLP